MPKPAAVREPTDVCGTMTQNSFSRLFVTGVPPVTNFMSRRALLLLAVSLLSSGLLLTQYFLSAVNALHGHGFLRSFNTSVLVRTDSLTLTSRHYYAGVGRHSFYLGRWGKSEVLQVTPFLDTTLVTLSFPKARSVYKFTVDYSRIFAEEMGYDHILVDSFPPTGQARTVIQDIPLIDAAPLNATDIAVVTLDDSQNAFELAKTNGTHLVRYSGLLKKQVDGKFCVDGMLRYDRHSQILIYLYYYRNQFLVLDTGMHLLYGGRTIDTTRHADIQVAHIPSGDTYYLSSPARVVNKRAHVSGGQLYVRSMLIADNEDQGAFKRNMVIDVYQLTDGAYQFSFYLPKRNGKDATEFWVVNQTFCVLYRDQLDLYSINWPDQHP